MEVVEVVSDDLVECEPGGAGLRLDDRRRAVFAGEVAVDRICLEAIGKLCEELFRPLGVGVVATERASTVIWYLNRFAAPQPPISGVKSGICQ